MLLSDGLVLSKMSIHYTTESTRSFRGKMCGHEAHDLDFSLIFVINFIILDLTDIIIKDFQLNSDFNTNDL